ncbi:MAG: tetratricopeptide repeat protein [Candidatus Hermodarchaeia archaeon]|jgi:tetratricopeptide (TPR) repeat protein
MDRTRPIRLKAALFLVSVVILALYISNGELIEKLGLLSSNAEITSETVREPEALSMYIEEVGILPIFMLDYSNVNPHEYWPGVGFGPEVSIDSTHLLASDLALAHANIAHAFGERGQIYEAEAWLEQALRLDPNLPEVILASGFINYRFRRTNQAISDFWKVIKLDPDNFYAYFYLGQIYNGRENANLALIFLNKAVDLASTLEDQSLALTYRANSYSMLWRYDECFADLDLAEELDPDNGLVILMRAVVQEAITMTDRQLDEILEERPDEGEAKRELEIAE